MADRIALDLALRQVMMFLRSNNGRFLISSTKDSDPLFLWRLWKTVVEAVQGVGDSGPAFRGTMERFTKWLKRITCKEMGRSDREAIRRADWEESLFGEETAPDFCSSEEALRQVFLLLVEKTPDLDTLEGCLGAFWPLALVSGDVADTEKKSKRRWVNRVVEERRSTWATALRQR